MSTTPAAQEADWRRDDSGGAPSLGRFHIATLVMQRAKQLAQGARPRTEANGHKVCRVALSEVLLGAVEWSVAATPRTDPVST
jgi:DNA-directed RNA polymerase subunit K/omega